MPTFHYRALQPDGKIAEGKIEAGGRIEAFRQMESQSLRPITLKEGKNGGRTGKHSTFSIQHRTANVATGTMASVGIGASTAEAPAVPATNFSLGGNKISARVLENFTRLLSSLLTAGVPLSRALVILQKEAAN